LHVTGSNGGTFIWIYSAENPSHVLPNFATDKLVMQEVSYHISTGLSTRLHKKNKAPWPAFPLLIRFYELHNLKYVDAKTEEFKRFTFGTKSFNPYDLYCFVKDHCVRVKFPWIHGLCHWPEEDPRRYCHNFSKLNEPIDIAMEWLAKQCEATS